MRLPKDNVQHERPSKIAHVNIHLKKIKTKTFRFYAKAYFFNNLVNDGRGGGLYSAEGVVR